MSKTFRFPNEFNSDSIAFFHFSQSFLCLHSSIDFSSCSSLFITLNAVLYAKLLSTLTSFWFHSIPFGRNLLRFLYFSQTSGICVSSRTEILVITGEFSTNSSRGTVSSIWSSVFLALFLF